jgi:hypothetical protein
VLQVTRHLVVPLVFAAAAVATAGFALDSPAALALAAMLLGLSLAVSDVARVRRGGITPMTLYAVGSALTGMANFVGLHSEDTARRSVYFLYVAEPYLPLAMKIALGGTVFPVLGFWWVTRSRMWRPFVDVVPVVRGHVSDRRLVVTASTCAVVAFIFRLAPLPVSLGTFLGVVNLAPALAAFTLARAGAERRLRGALPVGLVIALADAVRAALYAYLRLEVILPLVAFTLGVLLGRRSLSALGSRWLLPIYGTLAVFTVYFTAAGLVRQQVGIGVGRVVAIEQQQQYLVQQGDIAGPQHQTVMSRLTSFNQLSQVGRVVDEDGFLGGQTLEYLAYAFIPRFLWPEKPVVDKGGWFAVRIGQAVVNQEGRITSAVNMTTPGELYVNFGWPGVLVGCLLFGGILAVFWTRTRFWSDPRNTVGLAFGFYLLWVGLGLTADLEVIVTLVAMYLIFLAGGMVIELVGRPAPRSVHAGRRLAPPGRA